MNNQLTSWNGTTLTYDLDGNMTSDGAVAIATCKVRLLLLLMAVQAYAQDVIAYTKLDYEHFREMGRIHLYDPKTGKERTIREATVRVASVRVAVPRAEIPAAKTMIPLRSARRIPSAA